MLQVGIPIEVVQRVVTASMTFVIPEAFGGERIWLLLMNKKERYWPGGRKRWCSGGGADRFECMRLPGVAEWQSAVGFSFGW